jgi:hypothetical protein
METNVMETKEEVNQEIAVPELVGLPAVVPETTDNLISNDKLINEYDTTLQNIKSDREEISDILGKFLDMVINDGDASAASKEAVVNLIKAKSETNDQVIKILDLWTRMKMKERNTFNPAIHAHQNNIYNLGNNKVEETRDILLDEIDKASGRSRRIR